ncbi:MAG TPA: toprim domain-containing protein [Nitrososphaerales archaeon]|nr:toprim domain-containing protein [Nitrososphaerales archaeon]
MIRARQRRATLTRGENKMIDKREKQYQAFGEFLASFVTDLNHLSEEGWAVLVEGQRDATALRKLGFTGNLAIISLLGKTKTPVFDDSKKVVILTDLDREGAVLAARYVKRLSHDGFRTSLKERLRLKNASHGVFLHIENLSRFAQNEA